MFQDCPSLQEVSCPPSPTFIGLHQCVIHYWCIHTHLVTQICPKRHLCHLEKELCLSCYHQLSQHTSCWASGRCLGVTSALCKQAGIKKHFLWVSRPLLLLHMLLHRSPLWFGNCFKNGRQSQAPLRVKTKHQSYSLSQRSFPREV